MTIKFVTPKGGISVIRGKCIALIGDDIDTDRIIPARFLKCVDFEALGKSVFEDDRKDLKGNHPFDLEYYQDANILIVNSNFGCGSSREHAPQALMRWGIRAIIGESFAEIFYSNCVAIGIPCFTVNKEISKEIQSKAEKGNLFFEINLNNSSATQETLIYNLNIKESSKKMFLTGEWDATSTLLNNSNLIEKKMNELPYIQLNRNYS
tara:strand:- start:2478 stop:3101 length:624 start_codon:yes stop_codon:yes gene_type:complete